eukprot:2195597-Rhodomonas_salina.2
MHHTNRTASTLGGSDPSTSMFQVQSGTAAAVLRASKQAQSERDSHIENKTGKKRQKRRKANSYQGGQRLSPQRRAHFLGVAYPGRYRTGHSGRVSRYDRDMDQQEG